MKIGIVSSYFYPWYGGITEHVFHQYRELKRRGHEVRIITPFDGGGVLQDKGDLLRLGKPFPFFVNGSVARIPIIKNATQKIEAILASEQFDILHLHQPLFCVLSLSFLRRIAARRKQGLDSPKVVGTFHASGGGTERFLINRFGFFFRRFGSGIDYRIAVSSASRDTVSPVLPGEYDIIPNGVDINRFAASKEKIDRFDDGIKNILFVGRPEPRKGLTSLIKCIPFIERSSRVPFRILIVGNGVFSGFYQSKIPKGFEDRVVFAGEASFDDLPRYYRTADIFCSPATYGESFGIVLIEAMAAGVPIVAGDNEGYRRVISNGLNGLLVDSRNPEAIAGALAELLNSDRTRNRLVANGLEECQKYSWHRIISRLEDGYVQLIEGHNQAKRAVVA